MWAFTYFPLISRTLNEKEGRRGRATVQSAIFQTAFGPSVLPERSRLTPRHTGCSRVAADYTRCDHEHVHVWWWACPQAISDLFPIQSSHVANAVMLRSRALLLGRITYIRWTQTPLGVPDYGSMKGRGE